MVRMLLENGANVNARNGDALLMALDRFDNVDKVKMLLRYGADINMSRNGNKSVIDIAAERGLKSTVKVLKKHKLWRLFRKW
jgi:ankyrin repeat protein